MSKKYKLCNQICKYQKWGICVRPKEQTSLKEFYRWGMCFCRRTD